MGSIGSAIGLGLLALDGFYQPDGLLALAVVPLAMLGGGAAMLGQLRWPSASRR